MIQFFNSDMQQRWKKIGKEEKEYARQEIIKKEVDLECVCTSFFPNPPKKYDAKMVGKIARKLVGGKS